jgi:phage terminase large subunit GpA-like protein
MGAALPPPRKIHHRPRALTACCSSRRRRRAENRLVWEVVGWGRGKGVEYRVSMLAVDSGAFTQTVYGWARRYPMNRVAAVRGDPHAKVFVSAPSPVDVSVGGRKLSRGYKVWPVGVDVGKTEFYGWLRLATPTDESGAGFPPGYCHFPEYGEDYFREITAEQQVPHKKKGGFVALIWELIPGRQNHWLDCRIYARAAAAILGLDRYKESDWLALEGRAGVESPPPTMPPSAAAPAPASSSPVAKPTGTPVPWIRGGRSWLKRR